MPLVSGGIGLLGSFFSGSFIKNDTKVPNKAIVPTNTVGWGAGVGTVTGDPVNGLSAAAGSLVASFLYSKLLKPKKRKR
jgi:hypothetical protein